MEIKSSFKQSRPPDEQTAVLSEQDHITVSPIVSCDFDISCDIKKLKMYKASKGPGAHFHILRHTTRHSKGGSQF